MKNIIREYENNKAFSITCCSDIDNINSLIMTDMVESTRRKQNKRHNIWTVYSQISSNPDVQKAIRK